VSIDQGRVDWCGEKGVVTIIPEAWCPSIRAASIGAARSTMAFATAVPSCVHRSGPRRLVRPDNVSMTGIGIVCVHRSGPRRLVRLSGALAPVGESECPSIRAASIGAARVHQPERPASEVSIDQGRVDWCGTSVSLSAVGSADVSIDQGRVDWCGGV